MVEQTGFEAHGLTLAPYDDTQRWPVIGLIAGCYMEYGQVLELDTLDADLLRIQDEYAPPAHTFQVLLAGERLVGTVAVRTRDGERCELKRVFLDPALRGRGLGRGLVEWGFAWAHAAGLRTVDIWSDVLYTTAHHLYRRLACDEPGTRRTLGGRNAVDEFYFQKRLF